MVSAEGFAAGGATAYISRKRTILYMPVPRGGFLRHTDRRYSSTTAVTIISLDLKAMSSYVHREFCTGDFCVLGHPGL